MPHRPLVEVVEAARGGDPDERDALIEAVWPDAYRLAYTILRDKHAAEDAAQEACIVIYRSVETLRRADAFRTWFYRIVVREAGAVKRRRGEIAEALEATTHASDRETAIDVWRALATLPENLRIVVILRHFEELSSREIASVLRIPDGTVRFRLMVARRKLQPLLRDLWSTAPAATSEVHTHAI